MRLRDDEKNPQAMSAEYQSFSETGSIPEKIKAKEASSYDELFRTEEMPANDSGARKSRVDDGSRVKQLAQYLSTVAAALTVVTVTILANPQKPQDVSPPPNASVMPSLSVENELIGLDNYSCIFGLEDFTEDEIYAVLSVNGDAVSELAVDPIDGICELSYDGLEPETEYRISFVNGEDSLLASHSFVTEPFVTLSPEENGRIDFTLHEDITMSETVDMGVRLVDIDGKEFSNVQSELSNNLENVNYYILTDGIFRNTYYLEVLLYSADSADGEAKVYRRMLELGTLESPVFTVSVNDGEMVLEYISGDMDFYSEYTVEIFDGSSYKNIYGENIAIDGGNIYAALSETLLTGTYTVTVWGSFDNGEVYLYNPIFSTEITI